MTIQTIIDGFWVCMILWTLFAFLVSIYEYCLKRDLIFAIKTGFFLVLYFFVLDLVFQIICAIIFFVIL